MSKNTEPVGLSEVLLQILVNQRHLLTIQGHPCLYTKDVEERVEKYGIEVGMTYQLKE